MSIPEALLFGSLHKLFFSRCTQLLYYIKIALYQKLLGDKTEHRLDRISLKVMSMKMRAIST